MPCRDPRASHTDCLKSENDDLAKMLCFMLRLTKTLVDQIESEWSAGHTVTSLIEEALTTPREIDDDKIAQSLIEWKIEHEKEDEVRLANLKENALSKLTDEEKLILGLTDKSS